MSYWNYRIIEFTENDEISYQIYEVYYDDNDKIKHYADEPLIAAESVDGLKWMMNKMYEALNKPVLKESDFYS